MTFEWFHYLNLAKELEESSRQSKEDSEFEAKSRSCISRAYYAAFHAALLYLEKKTDYLLKGNGRDSHSEVINLFKVEKNSKLRLIGTELNELRIARTRADYHLPCREFRSKQLMANEAKRALTRSHSIIKSIYSLLEVSQDIFS
jgi:uncharacterized protein (UPF0332 family)